METLGPSTTHPQVAQVSFDQSSSVTDACLKRLEGTLEHPKLQLNRLTSRSEQTELHIPAKQTKITISIQTKANQPQRRLVLFPLSFWFQGT